MRLTCVSSAAAGSPLIRRRKSHQAEPQHTFVEISPPPLSALPIRLIFVNGCKNRREEEGR